MEAKNSGRMTVKILSERFDKEVKNLKETVKILEKRLNESDEKVKQLEEKLAENKEEPLNHDEREIKCKVCEQIFEKENRLKKHVKVCHPTQVACHTCSARFNKNSDLEIHLEEYHKISKQFQCDQCDKTFALKWRFAKHMQGHANKDIKYCHFFNNQKTCPFEKIGCMFLHQHADICIFGVKCKNKLCQFKHIDNIDNSIEENVHDDLDDKFDQLTYMEKLETKDVFCDLYCNRGYDCHRCSEETNAEFIGCDLKNVTDVFETDDEEVDPVTYYLCKNCDQRFKNNENLSEHFRKSHTLEKNIKCKLSGCEFSTTIINVLIIYIGVDHLEFVQRKL